jgi:hypothetical protein
MQDGKVDNEMCSESAMAVTFAKGYENQSFQIYIFMYDIVSLAKIFR